MIKNLKEKDIPPQEHQPILQHTSPFPKNLESRKSYKRSNNDLSGELKNLCVKITLLQAIKNVPIYNKFIKEE
jgi:hypothetical protein